VSRNKDADLLLLQAAKELNAIVKLTRVDRFEGKLKRTRGVDNELIGPGAHSAIDYGFVTMQTLAPSLFGPKVTARVLPYTLAGTQGIINALTDHPVGYDA
jgi:hypothetical protein